VQIITFLICNDENGTLVCYQEFLRGPCKEGEQFNLIETQFHFEGKCVPTNSDNKDQIQYNETCVTIPECKKYQGIKLPSEKDLEAKMY